MITLQQLAYEHRGKVDLCKPGKPGIRYEAKNVDLMFCSLHYNLGANEYYLKYNSTTFGMSDIKPHRRSLSQLIETIEHEGKKFVPIDELYSIFADYGVLAQGLKTPTSREDFVWLFKSLKIEAYPNYLVEKLKSWHFAIGIPKGNYVEITK